MCGEMWSFNLGNVRNVSDAFDESILQRSARLLSPRARFSYLGLMKNASSETQRSNSLVVLSIYMKRWFDFRGRKGGKWEGPSRNKRLQVAYTHGHAYMWPPVAHGSR